MNRIREILWGSRTRRVATTAVAALLLLLIAANFALQRAASNWSEQQVRKLIETKMQSEIEFEEFQVSLLPMPSADARGVRFYHKGRRDVPPLVSLDSLHVSATLWDVVRSPIRVTQVRLGGLLIQVPPSDEKEKSDRDERGSPPPEESPAIVEEIIADGAELRILPREESKEPLVFSMRSLRLWHVGAGEPMAFETTMTNAKPPGDIVSSGRFGPWHGEDPGRSPVSGEYQFENADLGVFNGISGILSSTGRYDGVLGRLIVDGETDVPDFRVESSGHPVHLKTKFHAIVDGTSGDTFLEPVEAQFLQTRFTARGGVYQRQGRKGKSVELDVDIPDARIEDLLRLAVKGEPMPLVGAAKVKTKFLLPPGEQSIPVRLQLDGNFSIESAKFPDWNIQRKVESLNNRAAGEPDKEPQGDVVSGLSGDFRTSNGAVALQDLRFRTPAAEVALDGSYGMVDESLDFRGTLTMDAKVSQATTGFKSVLARLIDPFFSKKHAGAVIPIKITGTREDPKFGLSLGGGKK